MSKMGLHDPFEYLKHTLWLNEVSNPKSWESPWFTCMQVACHIYLESCQWGLKLCFRPHLNPKSSQEVMGLQSGESPNFRNFGIPKLGVPRQNDIWVQTPWPCINNTIKGKVVASPKFGLWWILWVCVCSWLVRAPKVFQFHTNQLVWFVQVRVNNKLTCHSS